MNFLPPETLLQNNTCKVYAPELRKDTQTYVAAKQDSLGSDHKIKEEQSRSKNDQYLWNKGEKGMLQAQSAKNDIVKEGLHSQHTNIVVHIPR